jgi:hypothetical protein
MPIDFNARATLHQGGDGGLTTTGKLGRLVRVFMAALPAERRSYTITVGETICRPAEIEALYRQLEHRYD